MKRPSIFTTPVNQPFFLVILTRISRFTGMYQKIISIILLIALSLSVVSQTNENINQSDEKGRKQGHRIKKYPNGNIMYEGIFKDDHPIGEFKRYFEDSTLWSVLVYSNDGKEVQATMYHPNGFIASKGKFINQMKEGKWQFFSYHIEGYLFNEEEYAGNLKNGLSVKYYPDSTLAEEINYVNDIKHGEWILYHSNGGICLITNYVNGKLNGRFQAFFENGKLEFDGVYKNDTKEGLWKIYKDDGSLRFETEYFAGTPKSRELDIYESNLIDSIEMKYKGKIADPEKTGVIW